MLTKAKIKSLLFRYSGLVSLKWALRPKGLYCFNYHRIGDAETCEFDPNVFSCSAKTFEQHLLFYKQHFTVIDCHQLEALVKQGKPFDRRYALITFDDGYIDNYQIAFPLLKKHQLSAIFFVVTNYVEENLIPWWDEIAWLVRHSKVKTVQLSHWDKAIDIVKGSYTERVRRLLRKIKASDQVSIEDKLSQIRALTLSVGLPKSSDIKLFADWQQLTEMAKNGMTIGSHTVSHYILSHLSEADQRQELFKSKQQIGEKLGEDVTIVAYPVGGPKAFTLTTQKIAKDCGYHLGFSFISGINTSVSKADQFCIKRIPIDGDVSVKELKMQLTGTRHY